MRFDLILRGFRHCSIIANLPLTYVCIAGGTFPVLSGDVCLASGESKPPDRSALLAAQLLEAPAVVGMNCMGPRYVPAGVGAGNIPNNPRVRVYAAEALKILDDIRPEFTRPVSCVTFLSPCVGPHSCISSENFQDGFRKLGIPDANRGFLVAIESFGMA